MRKLISISILLFATGLFSNAALAQNGDETQTNILFVVDGSSSMLKNWGKQNKWVLAKNTLVEIADSLLETYPNLSLGLRVYGHQSLPLKGNCKDTELKLPIGEHTVKAFKNKLDEVSPKGITPLAYTLEQVTKDFEGKLGEKNILILITDGAESCLGDPCAIMESLLENEVIVKPILIGLDIPIASLQAYHCLNDVYNPTSEREFAEQTLRLVNQSIRFTGLQVYLTNSDGQATQTNLPMFFYEENSNDLHYSFYHKLNKDNKPDTLSVDPAHNYYIKIQTIPPVLSDVFELSAAKHNEVFIEAPTGLLLIQPVDEEGELVITTPPIPYFIKPSSADNYIYHQELGQPQSYLSGNYDIDILTLPPQQYKDVSIDDGALQKLTIEAPGKLILNARFPIHGGLFQTINNELINIYSFKPNTKQEILDLQPGEYSIIYRFDHKRKMYESKEVQIQIKSTKIKEIKL